MILKQAFILLFVISFSLSCSSLDKNLDNSQLIQHKLVNRGIINGTDTKIEDTPWQVSLQPNEAGIAYYLEHDGIDETNSNFCGGVIFSDEFIITAAHCVDYGHSPEMENYQAVVGETDLSDDDGFGSDIVEEIVHEDFEIISRGWGGHYDIALLRLKDPIDFDLLAGKAGPIDLILPPQVLNFPGLSIKSGFFSSSRLSLENPGQTVIASGYGALATGEEDSGVLSSTEMVLIDNEDLLDYEYYEDHEDDISSEMIAANFDLDADQGTICGGDSGGPLAVLDGDDYKLIGITSFTDDVCENAPAVFMRISKLAKWIYENAGTGDCSTPNDLSSSTDSLGHVTLSWKNTGAMQYALRYRVEGADDWSTLAVTPSSAIADDHISGTLSGLVDDLTYEWQVRSECIPRTGLTRRDPDYLRYRMNPSFSSYTTHLEETFSVDSDTVTTDF